MDRQTSCSKIGLRADLGIVGVGTRITAGQPSAFLAYKVPRKGSRSVTINIASSHRSAKLLRL